MAKIKHIKAREILDSKGNPTIETTVVLQDGTFAIAACPSGTSVGTYEAVELRDHDEKRFKGLGVLKAIENIETVISPKLIGMEVSHQRDIDRTMIELDGTQNKSRLGANAILSVSIAVCKAASQASLLSPFMYLRHFLQKELHSIKIPTPLFNLINGGKHAGDNVNFQEYHVIPASSKPFQEGLQIGISIYKSLAIVLKNNSLPNTVGDEGGYAPVLSNNQEPFSLLKQAIESTSYRLDFDVFFGLDAASGSFYHNNQYLLKDKSSSYSSKDLIAYYKDLNSKYHLLYLEDGLSEDDWEGWEHLSKELSSETLIVGDDLTVTNPYRLQMALDKKAINGIIIKPNQIGTVIEALAVVEVAREAGLKITVSHRSGETNDDFISDFAVAVSSDYVKFGAPARGERVAKYNRLLAIEKQIEQIGLKR